MKEVLHGRTKYWQYFFLNRLIRCCFWSFCGVSTNNFIYHPSSQASVDPMSDFEIVAVSFSIYRYFDAKGKKHDVLSIAR